MEFQTSLITSGKSATGIVVPLNVYESLGTAKRHAVVVTINDFTYRSTVTPHRPRRVRNALDSNKRGFTVAIDEAKTPETRQRRIDKAVASLADQQPG